MKLILARNAHGNIDFPTSLQDRQRYQVLTAGGLCLYGKTTWDTLPPAARRNRESIIVRSTLTDTFEPPVEVPGGRYYCSSFGLAMANAKRSPNAWICGGKKLYDAVIHGFALSQLVTHVYLSTFPHIEGGSLTVLAPEGEWDVICLQKFDDHEFTILRRK